ncbi:hypothetical protein [Persephonella sp.]
MKTLELLKKKLKFDISIYKSKLNEIDSELEKLILARNQLYEKYNKLKNKTFNNVKSMHYKIEFLKSLKEKMAVLDEKIKVLEMKKEAVKLQMKLKNAEKKSIEKYIKTLSKNMSKKELKKELQLAEASFNNRH